MSQRSLADAANTAKHCLETCDVCGQVCWRGDHVQTDGCPGVEWERPAPLHNPRAVPAAGAAGHLRTTWDSDQVISVDADELPAAETEGQR